MQVIPLKRIPFRDVQLLPSPFNSQTPTVLLPLPALPLPLLYTELIKRRTIVY